MHVLQRIVIGLVVFTGMLLGVALGDGANETGDRERFATLFSKGKFETSR